MHSQRLYCANEDIEDFREALEAESDRRQGKRIPKTPNKPVDPSSYYYSEVIKYTDQIERYFKIFGRENILVIIFDDFKRDTPSEYSKVLRFLGLSDDFKPDFSIHNANKRIKNLSIYKQLMQPPEWLFALGRTITPRFLAPLRRKVAWGIINGYKKNLISHQPRPAIDPDFERELKLRFAPEVQKVSELLGRDLSHWSQPKI
jgi:hypothetical protein